FSLNIPAIKATIMSGLDHVYDRTKQFGLSYPRTAVPVLSMGIGTLEVHPIDLLGAYGTIANNGVRMPRQVIGSILNSDGNAIWPTPKDVPTGSQVTSAGAAYIVTDILAGNTDKKVNPFWGKWAIFNGGTRRPAAYKTGTTSDNRDVAAYGFVAPPADKKAPAIAVGVWMGNSDNSPNDGKLSLDTSAPLWSAILTEVTKGAKIAQFKPPSGLKTATVDAFTGLKPGPFTTKTVKELFLAGTVPTEKTTFRSAATVDAATGLLWQDGCQGPKVTRGYFNLSEVETNFPAWQRANLNWGARAARGSGVGGGPKGTRTSYFYSNSFAPFGHTWGAKFMPRQLCPLYTPPPPVCDPFAPPPDPALPPVLCVPSPTPSGGFFPFPTPKPTRKPR
ncbi:MAG: penicillin-binding transpeptidase domain-containing protein, partial [Chloroflexota bacterium]